ncbi:hypothetical protein [Kangiella sediminilitoris]|uniref:Uncharacterized protein n=1 Tax=Kangiella sediminilitoris TaxID=1144748 RepID=A0A1B3BDT0_9GAMM|nr:hypothetical protein [Kangiella sediminilitoris]AOE50923.1 hypothetical protein KS2013_2218 [Kangiella sediminilitoris]
MTAEVAVINQYGVALAADSAATLNNGKVYNTANKLFMLSKYEPIGIMINGSSHYMHVPWETLIKDFREELRDGVFSTLSEYVEHFWSYLEVGNGSKYFTENVQRSLCEKRVGQQIESLKKLILNCFDKELDQELDYQKLKARAYELTLQLIDNEKEKAKEGEILKNFNDEDKEKFIEEYSDTVIDMSKSILGYAVEQFKDEDFKTLVDLLGELIIRRSFIVYSEVVIAGYGKEELFPQLQAFNVGVMFNNKIRKSQSSIHESTNEEGCQGDVITFAQTNTARSFIRGVDPILEGYIYEYSNTLKNQYISLLKDSGALQKLAEIEFDTDKLVEEMSKCAESSKEDISSYIVSEHLSPMASVINSLPKNELIEMAESLVSMVALRMKMSDAAESVGGPVDVAVISKGDGFVWVKRKHYFKPEFNRHFFDNYYRH